MSNIRILTCSVTGGSTTKAQNPNLPVTPQEIATACLTAAEAGAAMVHVHVRDPSSGEPSSELYYYREVVQLVRAGNSDLLINLTTGPGAQFVPSEENPSVAAAGTEMFTARRRVEHVLDLRPDVCSFDIGTLNFSGTVVINASSIVREMAKLVRSAGVKPEIEIFDTGDLVFAHDLIAEGLIDEPAMFQFIMGGKYGSEASPELLYYMRNRLPASATWGGLGVGRAAFPMLAAVTIAGGHARIGLEDTVYLSRGVLADSNAALITKAVRMMTDIGVEVATPTQARDLLMLASR